jgi:hypothetical protein
VATASLGLAMIRASYNTTAHGSLFNQCKANQDRQTDRPWGARGAMRVHVPALGTGRAGRYVCRASRDALHTACTYKQAFSLQIWRRTSCVV